MVVSSNFGLVDFTHKRVRLDGRVLDKFSLVQLLRSLSSSYWWRYMYAYDTMSYAAIASVIEDFLFGDSDE